MHTHCHCKHELKYCEVCGVVYCTKCGKEWTEKFVYTYPNYTITTSPPNSTWTYHSGNVMCTHS